MKQTVLTDRDYAALQKSKLFSNLRKEQIDEALIIFEAYTQRCQKGEILHRAGSVLKKFGMVLQGSVQVYRDDINGDRQILANVVSGENFGESMCLLQVEEQPIHIAATQDSKIMWMSTAWMNSLCDGCTPFRHQLIHRFLQMLAERTLTMNDRIQILSKSTLRAKLITFFSQCVHRFGSTSFVVPFDRADMAVYLGADRSALSRELSKMRLEGLIDFDKNRFSLIAKIEEEI